jgi:hypothetical protein
VAAILAPSVGVLLATALVATATLAPSPARALQMRELAGWWIAIDDTFPKLWNRDAISAMEEVLQINLDGRVQDRMMNFWAGSPQACLDNKVCSDLPLISGSRLRVNGSRIVFANVAASNARLDAGAGDALIRREAITATPEWTGSIEGDRLTLRSTNPAKVRVLVRIVPERLRQLHAGIRVAALPAESH